VKLVVGDRYQNLSGDTVEVEGVNPIIVQLKGLRQIFTYDEVRGLVASGAWRWLGKAEPACIKCKTRNEYQSGPFVCWACANAA
jgi:hypothetical protein